MRSRQWLFHCLLSALSLFGCASGTLEEGEESIEHQDIKGDLVGQNASRNFPEISGAYHAAITSSVFSQDLREQRGARIKSDTEVQGVLIINQNNSDLQMALRLCKIKLPEIGGKQLTIDPVLYSTLKPLDFSGQLTTSRNGEVAVNSKASVVLLGLALNHPSTEKLPDHKTDPRVIDQDGDGQPGLSVEVSGFKVYLGARVIFSLHAEQVKPFFEGGIADISTDFKIYGDNIPFVNAARSADENFANTKIIEVRNRFTVEPLAGSTACPTR